jgi:hypothetical protein
MNLLGSYVVYPFGTTGYWCWRGPDSSGGGSGGSGSGEESAGLSGNGPTNAPGNVSVKAGAVIHGMRAPSCSSPAGLMSIGLLLDRLSRAGTHWDKCGVVNPSINGGLSALDRIPHQISLVTGYLYSVPMRSVPVASYPSGTGVALR